MKLRAHRVFFLRPVQSHGDDVVFTIDENRFVIRHYKLPPFPTICFKLHQSPLFPPLSKGDFWILCELSGPSIRLRTCLAGENFWDSSSNILNGSFTHVGCDNQRRIQTFRDLTHRARLWDTPQPSSSPPI